MSNTIMPAVLVYQDHYNAFIVLMGHRLQQAVATNRDSNTTCVFLILTTRCQSNLSRIVEFPRLHIKTLTQRP